MNNSIKITHNGDTYTLEYDRMSIKMLEKAGFKYEEFLEKPMTNIELAFSAAFLKNHQGVNQNIIDEIYDGCKDKTKLIGCLNKMINDCYESLFNENEKTDSGNTTWEIVDLTPSKKEKNLK